MVSRLANRQAVLLEEIEELKKTNEVLEIYRTSCDDNAANLTQRLKEALLQNDELRSQGSSSSFDAWSFTASSSKGHPDDEWGPLPRELTAHLLEGHPPSTPSNNIRGHQAPPMPLPVRIISPWKKSGGSPPTPPMPPLVGPEPKEEILSSVVLDLKKQYVEMNTTSDHP